MKIPITLCFNIIVLIFFRWVTLEVSFHKESFFRVHNTVRICYQKWNGLKFCISSEETEWLQEKRNKWQTWKKNTFKLVQNKQNISIFLGKQLEKIDSTHEQRKSILFLLRVKNASKSENYLLFSNQSLQIVLLSCILHQQAEY